MSTMISLNGENYHIWRNRMEDLLFVREMHLPVFATTKPDDKTDEEWAFEHKQVCDFIRKFVEDNICKHICDETHAQTLWKKLEDLYFSKMGNNKLLCVRKLFQLKYQEGASMADHLNDLQGIVQELSFMSLKFDDELLAIVLLNSLPESWETLKISLTNSAPNGVLSMEYVQNRVLNEEIRRKLQACSLPQQDVFVSTCGGRNQFRSPKSRDKSQEKSNKYTNMECHHCKKKGHIKKFCRKLKQEQKNKEY